MSRQRAYLAAAIIATGTLLRCLGIRGDFWLDEIWSYDIARSLTSPLQILTAVHHDNNHYLNTFFLYELGEQAVWQVYRIPALLAGIAALAVGFVVACRYGSVEGLIATLLLAVSYPLVHYSSEARGYSFAVLFALTSLGAWRRIPSPVGAGWALAFAVSACLGVVSHLVFLLVLPGFALSALLRVQRRGARAGVLSTLALAVPAALVLWLWRTTLSKTEIGGAPDQSISAAIVQALSCAAGGPDRGAIAIAVCGAALAIVSTGIALLTRESAEEAAVVGPAFALPAALLWWQQPDFAYLRYFILSISFALLAAAVCLGWLWRRGGAWRLLAAALLMLTLAGNLSHVVSFLRTGRGDYSGTLRYAVEHSDGPRVTFTGDHAFRNTTVLRFYARRLATERDLVYVDIAELPPEGADWMLLHRFDDSPIAGEVTDRRGNRYHLERRAEFYGLSGWTWHLYRRAPADQRRP